MTWFSNKYRDFLLAWMPTPQDRTFYDVSRVVKKPFEPYNMYLYDTEKEKAVKTQTSCHW